MVGTPPTRVRTPPGEARRESHTPRAASEGEGRGLSTSIGPVRSQAAETERNLMCNRVILSDRTHGSQPARNCGRSAVHCARPSLKGRRPMTPDPVQTEANRSGLAGVLKLIAILAVVLLALLGVLVVLDVIPRDVLGELATKIVLIACIFALASTAPGFLVRSRKR